MQKFWHRSMFLVDNEGKLYREQILPKGWQLSDYDKEENLIEIEDTKNGERFWLKPGEIFKHPCRPHNEVDFKVGLELWAWHCKVNNVKEALTYPIRIKEFVTHVRNRRNQRCYLQVRFEEDMSRQRDFNFIDEGIGSIQAN